MKYISISKKVKKEIERNPREAFRTAWNVNYNGAEYQIFINSNKSAMYMMRAHLAIPTTSEAPINFIDIFPRSLPDEIPLANFPAIIEDLKETPRKQRAEKIVKIGIKHFRSDLIAQVYEIIGEITAHYQADRWNAGDILTGIHGVAFVLPCRPPKEREQ